MWCASRGKFKPNIVVRNVCYGLQKGDKRLSFVRNQKADFTFVWKNLIYFHFPVISHRHFKLIKNEYIKLVTFVSGNFLYKHSLLYKTLIHFLSCHSTKVSNVWEKHLFRFDKILAWKICCGLHLFIHTYEKNTYIYIYIYSICFWQIIYLILVVY